MEKEGKKINKKTLDPSQESSATEEESIDIREFKKDYNRRRHGLLSRSIHGTR